MRVAAFIFVLTVYFSNLGYCTTDKDAIVEQLSHFRDSSGVVQFGPGVSVTDLTRLAEKVNVFVMFTMIGDQPFFSTIDEIYYQLSKCTGKNELIKDKLLFVRALPRGNEHLFQKYNIETVPRILHLPGKKKVGDKDFLPLVDSLGSLARIIQRRTRIDLTQCTHTPVPVLKVLMYAIISVLGILFLCYASRLLSIVTVFSICFMTSGQTYNILHGASLSSLLHFSFKESYGGRGQHPAEAGSTMLLYFISTGCLIFFERSRKIKSYYFRKAAFWATFCGFIFSLHLLAWKFGKKTGGYPYFYNF